MNATGNIEIDERVELAQRGIELATDANFYPALAQRDVDWETVALWAEAVREPGFAWKAAGDRSMHAIIVGPGPGGRIAIHAGQHRILGGLIGGNPVPVSAMDTLSVWDRTRGWRDPASAVSVHELLRL